LCILCSISSTYLFFNFIIEKGYHLRESNLIFVLDSSNSRGGSGGICKIQIVYLVIKELILINDEERNPFLHEIKLVQNSMW